ncbi:putative gpcr [Schistosoma mansoni]|uniref:putative gpcr n=1 Tax=Schistosoma mansoni TaxID=6183 RepID=UPI00022DC4BA|nr:putative gpcr [Schistosoma mansoni]|eukprot:XP_018651413.1 putative gpcr [Schistosoma mansoni]
MIYMGTLAITDALTQILFGWLWVFPSKGLPYATLGNVYLFTFNISEDLCRLHRFAYSFTCALGGNLLILMAIDRCLCIYMPIKYNKIPKHYAWYLISIIIIITCLLMLPYGIVVGWHLSNNLLICWLNYDDLFLNIYHAFVSDSCLIQLIIVMGCNIAFMIKLHKLLKNRRQFMKNSEEKKELSASIVLVILCVTTLIASLPQSIAYIISFILPSIIMDPMELRGPLRLVYNIADIFWHLIFIQTSCNIFIYATPNSFPYKNLTTTNNDVYNNTVFPGLFCLLDSVAQNGDFSQLYDTLSQMYQTQRKLYENRDLRSIRRFKRNGSSFVLNHNLSTTPIEYAPNWSWFTPYHRSSASLKKLINFLEQSSVSFLPNSSSHIGVYSEVKSIMDTLTRSLYDCAAHNASYNPNDPGSGFNDGGPPSGMHWIHCFLPVSTAGLCELNEEIPINQLMQINYPSNDRLTNDDNHINNNDINHNTSNSFLFELMKRYPNKNLVLSPARICVNLIRAQIRGIELINTLQAVKQSYPDRLSLKEFCNRFVSLLPNSSKIRELKQNESLNKSIVHEILNSLHYSPETFQLGSNNIYLRTFIIPQLIHRLSYSPELSIDQELIHVQPDCKSYIIDCSNEQQVIIVWESVNSVCGLCTYISTSKRILLNSFEGFNSYLKLKL